MNPPAAHRQLLSSHASQRVPASVRQQAQRGRATVAEVLGRDPRRDDVFAGGTRLIQKKGPS